MTRGQGFALLPRGEGRSMWVVTDLLTFKAAGEDTGGACSIFELTVPPQGGPPPHVHHREDEAFFVLEGEFAFQAGDRTVGATAGSFVYAPKGIRHTYKNIGLAPGRMLMVATPAGIEKFFEEVGQPTMDPSLASAPTGPPDIQQLLEIARRHQIEIEVPSGGPEA
ncbi:MAG: quercetin 2,3-dioxygenase [Armatimonadetes bacterium]|nr:quercetin 2,3-dioxygenase [Armatimonadota bacterium]